MTLEEQVAKMQKDMEKMTTSHSAALTTMQEENDRMKGHMNAAVAKEKEVKAAKKLIEEQFETFKTEGELGKEQTEKMNELVAQKMEKVQETFDVTLNELNGQLSEAQGNFGKLKKQYDEERISGSLRKAAEKANVLPSAIDDVIHRANGVFSVSEDNKIESRDNDGNLRKIGKKIASPDSFVDSLRDTASHLWPPSGGSGAQGHSQAGDDGVNPWAKATRNFTEQARMKRADPAKAERMANAAKAAEAG